MNIKHSILSAASSLLLVLPTQAEEAEVNTKPTDSDKTHVTIIAGTHHYSPNKSMPLFKAELERLGLEVSIINPDWDPEKDKRGLPGLEVLKETDLAIFFIRWLQLEGEQFDHMMNYVKAGKPVVGLRTANHAFNYPKENPKSELNVGFGREVLGTPYLIHLQGSTKLEVTESEKEHPILTGITGTWNSPGTLYLSKLEAGAKPLLKGTGNSNKTGEVTNMYGTHQLEKTMTDNVAWTWTNKYGGKAFYASLGHIGDFAEPNSMRLMVNGIYWAAGLPVPSADTEIKTFKLAAKANKKKKKSKKK